MDKRSGAHWRRWVFSAFAPCILLTGEAFAQENPAQEPFAGPSTPPPSAPPVVATPPVPAPSTPAVVAIAPVSSASTPTAAQFEARIQQLEAMVNRLSQQIGQPTAPAAGGAAGGSGPTGGFGPGVGDTITGATATADIANAATAGAPSATGGVGAPGQSLPANPAPSTRFNAPATLERKKANVIFGPGFEVRSDDDEFILQFHNLTQFEYRGYQQPEQNPVHNTFDFPRQWWMLSGRITKPIGYFISIANGFDTLSLLDVFLDLEYDPRFRVRLGRFKTPFTYEFFVEPIQGLITPERSLFFNNFALNRDLGVMPYGRLFNNTLDYAGGVFNGTRNGYVANTDSKSAAAFVNWKPFANAQGSFLENLNIGGSFFGGDANSLPQPTVLRTTVPTSGNATIGVPFATFNSNVREFGERAFWDLHVAYFYKQLAVIAEWQSGFQDYAINPNLAYKTRLPVESYYVQAGYFLTGETRSSVGIVKPLRPFSLKAGEFGLGAFELQGRYNSLRIGNQIFTGGLVDPNNWTNNVSTIDLGFNWHFTQYLKFYFEWEHALFGDPVLYAPGGKRQLTSDMFMARIQLFF